MEESGGFNMTIIEAQNILGIAGNLTEKNIRDHYIKMITLYHPDRHQGEYDKIKFYEEKTKQINEAKDLLLNYVKTNNSKSEGYDFTTDFDMILARSKVKNVILFFFSDCTKSKLADTIRDYYVNNISIDKCNSKEELRREYEKFTNFVDKNYSMYEENYRISNSIPKYFNSTISYKKNVDEFLSSLVDLKNKYNKKISIIYNVGLNIFSNEEKNYNFKNILNELFYPYELELKRYNLKEEDEQGITNEFYSECDNLLNYFKENKRSYLELKSKLKKLPNTFEKMGNSRDELLEQLDRSFLDLTFSETYNVISQKVSEFNYREEFVGKLHKYLIRKSSNVLTNLDQFEDRELINNIYDNLRLSNEYLTLYRQGKMSIQDLSLLYNLKFNDVNNDKIIFSMINGIAYDIYVRVSKNGEINNCDPFVLVSKADDVIVSLDNNKLSICSVNENKDELIPLNAFVNESNVINKSFVNNDIIDTVIGYYGEYMLCKKESNKLNIHPVYYVTNKKIISKKYQEGMQNNVNIMMIDIKSLFQPYLNNLQSKSKTKKMIKIK